MTTISILILHLLTDINNLHMLTQSLDALLEASHFAPVRPDDVGFPLKFLDSVELQLAVGVVVEPVTSLPAVAPVARDVIAVTSNRGKAATDEEKHGKFHPHPSRGKLDMLHTQRIGQRLSEVRAIDTRGPILK